MFSILISFSCCFISFCIPQSHYINLTFVSVGQNINLMSHEEHQVAACRYIQYIT